MHIDYRKLQQLVVSEKFLVLHVASMIEKDSSVIRGLCIIDNIIGLVLLEPANERIEL